jgi:chromosome segregation ATPase
MAKKAHVTSVEVLESFRCSLILYLEHAKSAMDDTRDEVRRTRNWVQQDQRQHWEGRLRRLRKQLEQAEAELFTSRLSALTDNSAARQMAVTRLRRMVRDTEEKLGEVKRWARSYDSVVDPLAKRLESLQHLLSQDLPKAVTTITNAQKALDAYRQIRMEDAAPDRPDGNPADGISEGREESA